MTNSAEAPARPAPAVKQRPPIANPNARIELTDVDLDLPLDKKIMGVIFRPKFEPQEGSRVHIGRSGSFVRALSDVNLTIESGDRVGLIGSNGAGKSTLLRVLAKIYTPTRGKCSVTGRISTLFVSTVGVNANASGRENIFLSARTLGMSRAKIAQIEQDVIDFADVGDFIDLPLSTYSTGMRTRLGFAIATALEPEILLVDEVFGVGDKEFRKKAEARIANILRSAGILVMASHNNGIMREFCNKVCWIDQGKVAFYGAVVEGLRLYAASIKGKPA